MARGERWGWAELMSLLKHPDPLVVRAAALASGRIAKPLPIKVMQDTMKRSKEPTRSAMVAGLLAAGDTLLTRRQFKEATAIFDALRADRLAPPEQVTALARRHPRPQSRSVAACCWRRCATQNPSAFQAALRAADEMPDPKVTQAFGG